MRLPVAILAGGLATRLRPLTERIPKALLEVDGRPFAMHQLELLRRQGFTKIVFCVGYLGEQVQEALGNGHTLGMDLQYVFDGPTLLGTAGSLRQALPLLGDRFLVMYGDSYLECDYGAVEGAFLSSGKQGLMTVLRNANQWDRSNVIFKEGRIIQYDKQHQTAEMQHIDYGLGALQAAVFASYPSAEFLDLASIYQDLIERDQLAGFEVTQRFYEIGSPGGLTETDQYLSKKKNSRAVFLDRDGVLNRVVMRHGKAASPRNIDEFIWEDEAIQALARLKHHGFTLIVVTNQPDISRGKMSQQALEAMSQRIFSQTSVDAVHICPHDDPDGCHCRKPKPGLLHQAARHWGIDFQQSFMVGDSWKDMAAGQAAGCLTILLDRPYNQGVACDYRVAKLEAAVDLILSYNGVLS